MGLVRLVWHLSGGLLPGGVPVGDILTGRRLDQLLARRVFRRLVRTRVDDLRGVLVSNVFT